MTDWLKGKEKEERGKESDRGKGSLEMIREKGNQREREEGEVEH